MQKHVIGCRHAGFFSNFFAVLHNLDWCVRKNIIPIVYWDSVSRYYNSKGYNGKLNAWEYYFEPTSHLSYEPGDVICRGYQAPDGVTLLAHLEPSREFRRYLHNRLIKPFIKPNKIVQNKLNLFFNKHMKGKYTIGIHLRGTDKHQEIKPVPIKTIIQTANALAQQIDNCQFFIATDDARLLETAKATLNRPVIYYDAHRSTSDKPVHFNDGTPLKNNTAALGEEVLIDALLLARCNKFIHTSSNVSIGVLILNPELDNILLTAE